MNIDHLRYFQKLAETGHFSKAAKELCITQPALSNSIRKLENQLGFTLFESTDEADRSVRLTVYGNEFARHINAALAEIDQALNVAGPRALDHARVIKLGSVASVRQSFLPRLLADFVKTGSSIVNFDLIEERSTFKCTKAVLEGRMDMALCGRLPHEENIGFVPVLHQTAVVAVNPQMPLARQKSVSLADLRHYPLISYRDRACTYYPFKELARRNGFTFHQAFEDELNGAVQVLADMRLVALMLDTVEGAIRDQVKILPIAELGGPFHAVGIIYRLDAEQTPEERAFLEFAKARAATLAAVTPPEQEYLPEE